MTLKLIILVEYWDPFVPSRQRYIIDNVEIVPAKIQKIYINKSRRDPNKTRSEKPKRTCGIRI